MAAPGGRGKDSGGCAEVEDGRGAKANDHGEAAVGCGGTDRKQGWRHGVDSEAKQATAAARRRTSTAAAGRTMEAMRRTPRRRAADAMRWRGFFFFFLM